MLVLMDDIVNKSPSGARFFVRKLKTITGGLKLGPILRPMDSAYKSCFQKSTNPDMLYSIKR